MEAVGLALVIGMYALIILVITVFPRRRAITGELKSPSWRYGYTYKIGDNIFSSARGNGMEVMLPKLMPEIFIDSHADKRRVTTTEYIKGGQKIMLEGDFNNHFQVYVARGAEQLALSILTPDVMAALIDSTGSHDVRIVGHSMQIFSNTKIYKDSIAQQRMINASYTLVGEIDHRLKSWQDNPDNLRLLATQSPERMFRIGNAYFRLGSFIATIVTGFFGACFMIFGLALSGKPQDRAFSLTMIGLGLFFFPILWVFLIVMNRMNVFKQ